MSTLLARNAALVVTMDTALGDIADGAIFCRDGVIQHIGPASALPPTADEVLDLANHIVVPGLVNTHHHLFQNLTRGVPAAQNAPLFDWLRTHIHGRGSLLSTADLVLDATGTPLGTVAFERHLRERYLG